MTTPVVYLGNQALYGGLNLPLAIWRGVIQPSCGRIVAESVHVLFVMAGLATLMCGKKSIPVRPGNVLVMPRRLMYSVAPTGFLQGISIYLRHDFLEAHLRWTPKTHPLTQHLRLAHNDSDTAGVVDIGEHGVRAMRAKLSVLAALAGAPSSEFAILARVADVFDHVALLFPGKFAINAPAAHGLRTTPHAPVVFAIRALHERLDESWTVTKLAREAAISASQLSRQFRQDLGISPAAYLWNARTDRMAELLATSDISVAEASSAAGWKQSSASGRAFKRRYGMSPSVFAAAARAPGPNFGTVR